MVFVWKTLVPIDIPHYLPSMQSLRNLHKDDPIDSLITIESGWLLHFRLFKWR